MADLPKLSPKYQAAVNAYRENGGDQQAAYLAAYPNSIAWKPETLKRNAEKLFKQASVQAHITGKPIEHKRKRKSRARPGAVPVPPPPPPSKLTPEVRKLIGSYLDEYETVHNHPFPSVVGLAKLCKVSRETIYEWARNERHQDLRLSDTLAIIKTFQHADLLHKGFRGEGNSTITALLLKTDHGHVERSEVEHSGPGGGPMQVAAMSITADMPAAEASKIYMEMLRE